MDMDQLCEYLQKFLRSLFLPYEYTYGFTIHPEKSVPIPTQKIIFLGFIINSANMTITLTKEKKEKIFTLCKSLRSDHIHTIRTIAKFIGNIVASFPAVTLGPFFYRSLELDKISALKYHKGNFDKPIHLCEQSKKKGYW